MKKVFEEYSNIDVNPKALSPEEIINLDDFSSNFNIVNSLELLSGIVDKDVFVEFEVADKNIIPFLDTNNLEEKPYGKVLETWGVYATPYGAFFDKVLAFELKNKILINILLVLSSKYLIFYYPLMITYSSFDIY